MHAAATLSWLSSFLAAVMGGASSDDAILLDRMASGDRSALREIYTRVGPRAMAVAVRLLKDRGEAEDVVQDTFVDLWKRAGQFNAERGTLSAWLVTMTRHRALDRLRARRSSTRAVEGVRAEPTFTSVTLPSDLTDEHRNRHRVAEALASLPFEQRQVIELAYFDGLTQSEIAAQTKEPLGTVKTRVRLAMAKLADVLGDKSEGAA